MNDEEERQPFIQIRYLNPTKTYLNGNLYGKYGKPRFICFFVLTHLPVVTIIHEVEKKKSDRFIKNHR